MTAEQISAAVMNSVHRAGLVEVEVSARHVHLSQADADVLFGPGVGLEPARPLSQPGQFLSQQRVTLIGPKGRKERTAVLGPVRPASQVELSKSDCVELGVEGVIIARNHIHVTAPDSIMFDLRDKQRVDVALLTERPVVLRDVLIRVSTRFSCKMHIDFDEANAALVKGFTLGRILR